jgi:hypothetical protein
MHTGGIANVISHWDTMLEGVQMSPLAFYAAVEQAILRRKIPSVTVSRVSWREGGLFSARRLYLRARRKGLIFDICGVPVGGGFLVAWWLGEAAPGLRELFAEIPVIGAVFERAVTPVTYFEVDTAAFFQRAVHASVLEVVDQVGGKHGLRRLTPNERRPVMRELYER